MSRASYAVALAVVIFGLPSYSSPRSCDRTGSPLEALTRADALFTGHVTSMRLAAHWERAGVEQPADECRTRIAPPEWKVEICQSRYMRVQLQILRVWKGEPAEEVEVRTDVQATACGFDFRIGDVYLVYADRAADGALYVYSCSRTRLSATAKEDLKDIGEPIVDIWKRQAEQLGILRKGN